MSKTITLKLPEALERRIAKLAERTGKSPASFMRDAIAEKVGREELRQAFDELADARMASFMATGKSIPWSEMRAYLKMRANPQARVADDTLTPAWPDATPSPAPPRSSPRS